jgi:hypothetical protein
MADEMQTRRRNGAEQLVRERLAAKPIAIFGSKTSDGLGLPTIGNQADRIVDKLKLPPVDTTGADFTTHSSKTNMLERG